MRLVDFIFENTEYTLFVDLDGVLADFVKGVTAMLGEPHDENKYESDKNYRNRMWDTIEKYSHIGGELWYDLDLMPDAMTLWNYVKKYDPQILTATGTSTREHTANQKQRWVAEKLGRNVKLNMTQTAREKAKYAHPNYILIDDKEKAIRPWKEAGGIGILHTSAANTIRQLKQLGL